MARSKLLAELEMVGESLRNAEQTISKSRSSLDRIIGMLEPSCSRMRAAIYVHFKEREDRRNSVEAVARIGVQLPGVLPINGKEIKNVVFMMSKGTLLEEICPDGLFYDFENDEVGYQASVEEDTAADVFESLHILQREGWELEFTGPSSAKASIAYQNFCRLRKEQS